MQDFVCELIKECLNEQQNLPEQAEQLEEALYQTLHQTVSPDSKAMSRAEHHLNRLAKPIKSLGILEEDLVKIAGIQGCFPVNLGKKQLVVFCSDNGVTAENVTQTGQEVTAIVAKNMNCGETTAALLCKREGVTILPVDVGMVTEVGIRSMKESRGSGNIAKEPAMSRVQALRTICRGILLAGELKENGIQLAMAGEMGIGNTTTGSAVAAVLLDCDVKAVTGYGAGLDEERFHHKIEVIRTAICQNKPNPADPIDILSKVGGYDIAALCGFYLGCAIARIPVILDGMISCAAALLAVRMEPKARNYMIASQSSDEPASERLLGALRLRAPLRMQLRTGEGCGAVMLIPHLEEALLISRSLVSFAETNIEAYTPYYEEKRKEKGWFI